MMNNSIAMAVNRFTTDRTLTEYYNLLYQPAVSLRDIKRQIMSVEAIQSVESHDSLQTVNV